MRLYSEVKFSLFESWRFLNPQSSKCGWMEFCVSNLSVVISNSTSAKDIHWRFAIALENDLMLSSCENVTKINQGRLHWNAGTECKQRPLDARLSLDVSTIKLFVLKRLKIHVGSLKVPQLLQGRKWEKVSESRKLKDVSKLLVSLSSRCS
jgi:hypothetical protein